MADPISGVGGVQSGSNSQQPIGEQDFAQIKKPIESEKSSAPLTPAEKERQEKQQKEKEALFQPGTVTEGTVSQITDAFNELMEQINCDLELSYNKKANMLNVKMIDKKSGEVIKEFPPEEMLENMIKADENAAKLRGMFVDRAV